MNFLVALLHDYNMKMDEHMFVTTRVNCRLQDHMFVSMVNGKAP